MRFSTLILGSCLIVVPASCFARDNVPLRVSEVAAGLTEDASWRDFAQAYHWAHQNFMPDTSYYRVMGSDGVTYYFTGGTQGTKVPHDYETFEWESAFDFGVYTPKETENSPQLRYASVETNQLLDMFLNSDSSALLRIVADPAECQLLECTNVPRETVISIAQLAIAEIQRREIRDQVLVDSERAAKASEEAEAAWQERFDRLTEETLAQRQLLVNQLNDAAAGKGLAESLAIISITIAAMTWLLPRQTVFRRARDFGGAVLGALTLLRARWSKKLDVGESSLKRKEAGQSNAVDMTTRTSSPPPEREVIPAE